MFLLSSKTSIEDLQIGLDEFPRFRSALVVFGHLCVFFLWNVLTLVKSLAVFAKKVNQYIAVYTFALKACVSTNIHCATLFHQRAKMFLYNVDTK